VRALRVTLVLAGLLAGSRVGGGEIPNPRALPSLIVRWSWSGPVEALLVDEGLAYARAKGRVVALDAATGAVRWEASCPGEPEAYWRGPWHVGGVVVLSAGSRLCLLDRGTGQIRHMLDAGGTVVFVAGPPLIAGISIEPPGEAGAEPADPRAPPRRTARLVVVDAERGRILAQRDVGQSLYDLAIEDEAVVGIVGPAAEGGPTLIALEARDLAPRWSASPRVSSSFQRVQGRLVLEVDGEGDNPEYRPLDAQTGRIGEPLPQRESCGCERGAPWELQILEREGGGSRLRRNDPATGRALWTAPLDCTPGDSTRDGDRLYLVCAMGRARPLLLVLDWGLGSVRQTAYGLRAMSAPTAYHDLLVVRTAEGVAAVAARELGPPEAQLRSVAEELSAMLGRAKGASDYDYVFTLAAELRTLGAEALPLLVRQIPDLDTRRLVAVARVLAWARHAPAAAALAARLDEPLAYPDPEEELQNDSPQTALVEAVARVGGPAEVPALARVLADASRAGDVRRAALLALASIGTPAAVRAMEKTLATRAPGPVAWWSPPSPADFLDLAGTTPAKAAYDAAFQRLATPEGLAEIRRLDRAAASARVALPEGGALVVFGDAYLGGSADPWLAEVRPDGTLAGPAQFLGIAAGDDSGGRSISRIVAGLGSNGVSVQRRDAPAPVLVERAALSRDGDGDGLPDLVERRLGLDKTRSDTDGDGIPDGEDRAPNGGRPPTSEEDEIALAIFRQFFFFEADDGLIVVRGKSPLEWQGRRGPTLTLDEDAQNHFLSEAGSNGAAQVAIAPLGESPETEAVASDERLYGLSIYRGPLNSASRAVTVRRIGGRWFISRMQVTRVS
jgi:putative pyrroloquinoline-quinone binding quinoprotein